MCEQDKIPNQYLVYDFTYEGQRHRGKVLLDEDTPNLYMMYDDHDLEDIWFKVIRHKGYKIELNITVADDWNEMEELGKVVASAWVCVYDLKDKRHVIEQFEPDCWLYIDEANDSNRICRGTFYAKNRVGYGCKLCKNPDKCHRREYEQDNHKSNNG